MPFDTSFPPPPPAKIEQFRKLKALLNPQANALPNEMATARALMDRLRAEFPMIETLAADPVPPPAPGPTGWGVPGAAGPGWAAAGAMFHEFLGTVTEQVKARTRLLRFIDRGVAITPRVLPDGRARITVVIDADTLDAALAMAPSDQMSFSQAIGDLVAAEILREIGPG